MKKFLTGILFAVLTLVSYTSFAASNCPQFYPNSEPIELKNTIELCNIFYVSRYDVNNRAVVFTSEYLKTGKPVGSIKRIDSFKADSVLGSKSPKPADYKNTGYDKGHMVPADDASTTDEMIETFKMTNISPQEPTLNGNSWKSLETTVRKDFITSKKDMWVLTIAIYNKGGTVSNIPIPKGYWKITYGNTVKFYFAENKPYAKVINATPTSITTILNNSRNY
jgi:endonuclease G